MFVVVSWLEKESSTILPDSIFSKSVLHDLHQFYMIYSVKASCESLQINESLFYWLQILKKIIKWFIGFQVVSYFFSLERASVVIPPSVEREEIKPYQNISAKNSFLFRGLLVSDNKDHGSSFTMLVNI